jgi:hypothetical protein
LRESTKSYQFVDLQTLKKFSFDQMFLFGRLAAATIMGIDFGYATTKAAVASRTTPSTSPPHSMVQS